MRTLFSRTTAIAVPLLIGTTGLLHAQETPVATPTPETAPAATPSPTPDATATAAPAEATPTATPSPTPVNETVVVVTATRTQQTLAQATSAITVISRKQLEEKKPADLAEAIRLAPGVSVSQSGTRGKQTSVFLRGASPDQTLVLIDGVRVNAPSFGAFDFGTISVENIERIEVLRGPQSALYGSDAMGGVINIITRRGSGPLQFGGRLEGGDKGTSKQVFNASGASGKNRFSFSASRFDTDGFADNDYWRNNSASLRFDHELSDSANLAITGRFDDGRGGSPGQLDPIYFGFDPNARFEPRSFVGNIEYTNEVGNRSDRVAFGIFNRRMRYSDPLNPGDPYLSQSQSRFRDRVLTAEAQSSFELGEHTLTAGVEFHRHRGSFSYNSTSVFGPYDAAFGARSNTQAIFLQDEYKTGRWTFVPGVRFENNSQYGRDFNGRLAASYELNDGSRLKASIGTAFQAPTFDQLYYPPSGVSSNPDLKPEESVGYDFGYERELGNGGRFEATLFRNEFKNLIQSGFPPINLNKATTQGLELYLNQPLGRKFRTVISHTFLNADSSGAPLVRRPKYATTADLIYHEGKAQIDLGFVAQGRRYDIGPRFTPEPFGGYHRFDLTGSYLIRPGVQAYIRAQNLFNNRYQEVAGYYAPRFNIVFGLQSGAF